MVGEQEETLDSKWEENEKKKKKKSLEDNNNERGRSKKSMKNGK